MQGVFIDADGNVVEGAVMNVGILTHDGEVVFPPFTNSLAGLTLLRVRDLLVEVRFILALAMQQAPDITNSCC